MAAPIAGELRTITSRRRADPIAVARLRDFRCAKGQSVDARQALAAGNFSPYADEPRSRQIVLVDMPPSVDLAAAPFYYQAQFGHAQRILLVGHEDFCTLASERTANLQPLMIYSTGRAGTTLLSRMLERLRACESLSEPDVYTALVLHGYDVAQSARLAGATTRFLAAAAEGRAQMTKRTHLALKLRGVCVELAPAMRQAVPEARELFLYRDAEAYVASSLRAFGYFPSPLWWIDRLHRLRVTRPLLHGILASHYRAFCRLVPLAEEYTPRELMQLGAVGLTALSWLSVMHRAWSLAEAGRPIKSLRYERLVADPETALRRIVEHAGLPTEGLASALEVRSRDSQQGTILERERRARYALSQADREMIRRVLARHPVINRSDFELPDAIA